MVHRRPPLRFNVQASAEIRLRGLIGGLANGKSETVLSSTGFAACYGPPGRRIGLGKIWGQPLKNDLVGSCDVAPYSAKASTAQAAQAGGPSTLTVPAATKVAVIELRGSGGAPKVTLTGPDARTVVVPDGPEALQTPQALVIQDTDAAATRIALFDPPAGTWTITPSPLSVPLAAVRKAFGLPVATVRASTRRVRG